MRKARKRTAQWWDVYRRIVVRAFRGTPGGTSFYPTAAAAADAALEVFGVDPYEQESSEMEKEVNLNDLTPADADVHVKDTSWFIAAVDRKGDAWILDGAVGLFDYDVLVESNADDNGVDVPAGLKVGLYRVTNVKIREVGSPEDPDVEITGTWTPEYNGMTHLLYETGDEGAPAQIKDSNGEVVLGLCRRCGAAEIELDQQSCAERLALHVVELVECVNNKGAGVQAKDYAERLAAGEIL